MKAFYKIKLELQYDSAVLHLSIYSKGAKLAQHRDTRTSKYIAAPFTIVEVMDPTYVCAQEWRTRSKVWCTCKRKKNKAMVFAGK